MFTLRVEYITGRCVAADPADARQPEWPPHPGRLYMALAAALFEEDGTAAGENAALEWLEQLAPPQVAASEAQVRNLPKTYVPVNDDAISETKGASLSTIPGVMVRKRAERAFAIAIPDDPVVHFHWPKADGLAIHQAALDRLCARVARVGHASSLVHVTREDAWAGPPTWIPKEMGKDRHLMRVPSKGTLANLKATWQPAADWLETWQALQAQTTDSALPKAKGAAAVKELASKRKAHDAVRPDHPRPVLTKHATYVRVDGIEEAPIQGTCFSSEIIPLAQSDGQSWGLTQTLQLTAALRAAAMKLCDPPPEWLSGHQADGTPSKLPHAAFIPLAFTGHEHADGHGLGMAIILPKDISKEQARSVLGPLLSEDSGEYRDISLFDGKRLQVTLRMEERLRPSINLRPSTWTRPAMEWASVTPIVLDRFPKADYRRNRAAWQDEVSAIIASACARIGLPDPVSVGVNAVAFVRGVPRASEFPPMPVRAGKPPRFHVHAHLVFGVPVEGPVLLGAGRFMGYGLCRPMDSQNPGDFR